MYRIFVSHLQTSVLFLPSIRHLRIVNASCTFIRMALKQPSLKPQDLLVALKLQCTRGVSLPYAALAEQLEMSASEVHAAVQRATQSGLLRADSGTILVDGQITFDFLIGGVRVAFPAVIGPDVRGIPTAGGGPTLARYFSEGADVFVWPHSTGSRRGASLVPLFKSVPAASLADPKLYDILTLVDALRIGAAREREIATVELRKLLL
ncbi:MAG TPA: MarR family transcriptional regulator [Luteibacter sp.]|uniref:MarR family transcriptional regulator n=1 Tax=Luteibacter sp. TaxID=1886636 RepID=UPI002B577E60|nr:MarR family transcriptional regulator [Luteibacter sp.]HVI53633.1 MarR family transcriptional regulator [Luteibacter sp.]